MGKTAAKAPKFTLQQLIDRRMAVVEEIDSLTILKDQLGEQIEAAMLANSITKAMGSHNKGYQLVSSLKCEYAPEAVAVAEKLRLLHLFTPAPKITRSKVISALKADKITHTQYSQLEALAGPTYTEHTLKTFEAKQ